MDKIQIYPHSQITTVPLETSLSGTEVIIGSVFLDASFIKSTRIGLEAIELLNAGYSLSKTEDILSAQYQQNVSIGELIKILFEVNLISTVDGNPVHVEYQRGLRFAPRWIAIASILFSKSALWIYGLLLFTAVVMNINQSLNIHHVYSAAVQFAIQFPLKTAIIAWLLVLKHECFHYLAALSLGIPAHIKVESRYIFIVLVTQSDAVNLIEKKRRYRFYLAGIAGDIVLLAFLFHLSNFLALLEVKVDPQLLYLCFLQTVTGMIFQFNILFKTDLYFLITDYFGKDNLYTNSGVLIKYWFLNSPISDELENDTVLVFFAIGRILNYIFLTVLFALNIYLLFTHRDLFQHAGNTINGSGHYLYIFCYFALLLFVKIKERKNSKKYLLEFCHRRMPGNEI